MSNKNVIVVDDGLKTYTIENKNGKVLGEFSFNPSDTNIIRRYEEVVESLEKLSFESSEETEENLKKMEDFTAEQIDYLFNADVAKNFFSVMGAFTPLASGKYYIETVLEVIGQAISAETGERVKKINTSIRKHTGKYHK